MITKTDWSKHKEVPTAFFGTGDIKFSKAKLNAESRENILFFYNDVPKEIGVVSDEDSGKTTDELPRPEIAFVFTNPRSITALIHSLIELQKEVFEWTPPIHKSETPAIMREIKG